MVAVEGHVYAPLTTLIAGVSQTYPMMPGATQDTRGPFFFAAFLVVFILPIIIGTAVLLIAHRGRKVKTGTYTAPYPGRYPSRDYKPSRFRHRNQGKD